MKVTASPYQSKNLLQQKRLRKFTFSNHHFKINKEKIEIVSNYTYLGVHFSSNANFRDNKLILKEKTGRSIFATRRYLNLKLSPKLPTDLVNKLFNSLFLPILMYGSEVWGVYDKNDYNSSEKT